MAKIKNRIMTKEFVRKINEDADKNMADIEKNCSEEIKNYLIRRMNESKAIERRNVKITAIILFVIFLNLIIFALNS